MEIIAPHYVDAGELRSQDQLALADYLGLSDRAVPNARRGMPFFSGREAEISTFRQSINNIASGRAANATIAVEGPPGAGKSALLCQFVEDLRHLPPVGDPPRRWLPVFMAGASAMCPGEIMRAVDDAIARQLARDALASSPTQLKAKSKALLDFLGAGQVENVTHLAQGVLDRGFSVFGVGIGAKGQDEPASLRQVAALRGHAWGGWQVMLMVDEAQGITLQAPGAHPVTLSDIHQGATPLNLTFCAFGLPGTMAALADAGVSRTLKGHSTNLRGLDDISAAKVVARCFRRYGVVDAGAWRDAILERSANWPQHLSVYLTAALSVMRDRAGVDQDVGPPPQGCLSEAIRAGDLARSQYYGSRIRRLNQANPFHQECAKRIVPLLRNAGGSLAGHKVIGALAAAPLSLSQSDAAAFLDSAQHSGLLAPDDEGVLHLAIPTFAGHLLGEEPLPIPDEPDDSPQP